MIKILRKNDDILLITSSKDKCIKIWEAKTLNYIKYVELQSHVISICHIPDFDYLAIGT